MFKSISKVINDEVLEIWHKLIIILRLLLMLRAINWVTPRSHKVKKTNQLKLSACTLAVRSIMFALALLCLMNWDIWQK
jgi:1,4-dihydroxy-2-naphthoate octaprenyltransferase